MMAKRMAKLMGVSIVGWLAGCGGAQKATSATETAAAAAEVPESLKPAMDQVPAAEAKATGVQIYECKPNKDDPAKIEWTLKAPEAELVDAAGKPFAKHYAGPTWEAGDGSKVVGEVKARDPGPDATAIPWLLLGAKSNDGTGVLAKVTTIQRLATVGGKAPAEGCDKDKVGAEVRVPYRATYVFFNNKP